MFLVASLDLLHPIVNLLRFVESKNNLVYFILYFKVEWLLLIERLLIFLECSSFDIIESIVLLIILVDIEINIVLTHYCHVLLPYLCYWVFYVNETYLRSLLLDLLLLIYPHCHPLLMYFFFMLKGITYLQYIGVCKLIQVDW